MKPELKGSADAGGASDRRRRTGALVFLCLLLAWVLGNAAPALALKTHSFIGSFGPDGTAGSGFSKVRGVAVDQVSGNVYAYDAGEHKIYKFDAAGNPLSFSGLSGNAIEGVSGSAQGGGEIQLAVDSSNGPAGGDIYIADYNKGVSIYSSAGLELGKLGGEGSCGVATNSAGHVFLGNYPNEVREYTPTANPVTAIDESGSSTAEGLSEVCNVAVDGLGDVYAARYDGVSFAKLEGLGDASATTIEPGASTLAVDPSTDDLYADRGEEIAQYKSDGTPILSFGSGQLSGSQGVAVSATSGNVYAGNGSKVAIFGPTAVLPEATTLAASDLTGTTATLHGTVNPEGAAITECMFEYGPTTAYGNTAPCEEAIPSDESDHPVSAALTGLDLASAYHFRLVAANADGPGPPGADQSFETLGAKIEAEQSSNATSTEATLEATINPGGKATTYHFEYGLTTAYGQSTPELAVGEDGNGHPVAFTLSGLSPATAYHWRAVATNSYGTVKGADQAFATYPTPAPPETGCPNQAFRTGAPSADLPDCRAYEQATPINKLGGDAGGAHYRIKAALDGSAVSYFLSGGGEGGEGGQTFPTFLASRGGGGWTSRGLLIPSALGSSLERTRALSEDASRAYLLTKGGTLYVRTIPSASQEKIAEGLDSNTYIGGESADGAQVVVESPTKLLPDAIEGADNLYLWDSASGTLSLASILPNGSAAQGAFAGAYSWYNEYEFLPGFPGSENFLEKSSAGAQFLLQDVHPFSSDGSKLVFTTSGDGQIYVRSGLGGPSPDTVHVSASQKTNGTGPAGTDPNGPLPAQFMEATPDGEAIFFTSSEELTDDANTGPAGEGKDLYRYEVATGELTDLSPDAADPNGADVVGLLGTSDDGAYAYFAANGELAEGAVAGSCMRAFSSPTNPGIYGTCSIYAWHEGSVELVARGGHEAKGTVVDGRNWLPTWYSGSALPDEKSARVSSDGKTLSFLSNLGLTASAPEGLSEFYRYTAEEGLNCVSCSPAGVTPIGEATIQSINPGLTAPLQPENPSLVRYLSADGNRVFFETPDRLVPADANSVPGCQRNSRDIYLCQDVYEWEAEGTGSCHSDNQNGGCLHLISTGTGEEPAFFLDASANGDDIFFFTDRQLVGQDGDQLRDVYDARVGGGLAAQNPPPPNPCNGEACAGPPSSVPATQSPGSSSFSGPGNRPPKHHHKKKHKKKHHHKKKHKKKHHGHKKSKQQRQRGGAHR